MTQKSAALTLCIVIHSSPMSTAKQTSLSLNPSDLSPGTLIIDTKVKHDTEKQTQNTGPDRRHSDKSIQTMYSSQKSCLKC